jgi:endonuclease/exonuclease/phosphatase family metal-dependent hydrolase
LVDNGASGDLDVIQTACLGSGASVEDLPLPPEERSYLLGGAFGIGLLSKLPLEETDTLVLDAATTRRGIVYAKIDVPELGEVSVFCTHLTAVLPELSYEGSYETWDGENAAHVQALIDWVDEKTADGDKVIVLGDLNTSPSLPSADIDPEVPDSYALLPDADFADPFLDGSNAACTFCADNPLVRLEDTGVDANLDHIMTRGIDSTVTVERILDGLQSIEDDTDGGAPGELSLSDHYGLEATFFE